MALRNFVTAHDNAVNQNVLLLDLTHSNLKQRHVEIRFAVSDTLYDLRMKFYQTTGTPARDQLLQIFTDSDWMLLEIQPNEYVDDDTEMPLLALGLYPGVGFRVHCIDRNPYSTSANGALENINLVPKFRLTDEQYNQRSNTLRSWCQKQQVKDPTFTLTKYAAEQQALQQARYAYKRGMPLPDGFVVEDGAVVKDKSFVVVEPVYDKESVAHANVGERCQVTPGERRGRVAWVGELLDKSGWWVGVVLDEPVGQNDGCLDGIQYFQTNPKQGSFVRGPNVEVGDFPERDIWDDDDSDDEL